MNSYYSNELVGSVEDIKTSEIVLPQYLLRRNLNGVEGLAESIKKAGLLQPIIVRVNNIHSFELVAGYRRLNACKKLGWKKIVCHVVELDDKSAFEVSLVENVHRQTLNPIEEGLAFREYVSKFGWGGISELAYKISKSPGYVSKRMRLVELPDIVIDLLSKSEICVSTAEELLPVTNRKIQSRIALMIGANKLSSRNVRRILKENSHHNDDDLLYFDNENGYFSTRERIYKSFDKSIIALRIALKKINSIMESVEENWIIYCVLVYQRNILNSQIDLLIKEKKKFKNPFFERKLIQNLDKNLNEFKSNDL